METWQGRRGKNSRNSEENVGGEANGRYHKNRIADTTDREFHIQRTGKAVGRGSFPNKRILRNNLCLPACRILVYKRMALEI